MYSCTIRIVLNLVSPFFEPWDDGAAYAGTCADQPSGDLGALSTNIYIKYLENAKFSSRADGGSVLNLVPVFF
eukprot:SAG31_NODE_3557_length_4124_cov_8.785342_3_plen_73_part_00